MNGLPDRQTLLLEPDGTVLATDLTDELATLSAALGTAPPAPCPTTLGPARLALARTIRVPVDNLATAPDEVLWQAHRRGAELFRSALASRAAPAAGEEAEWPTWFDLKQELARRLLGGPCRLCARRCGVERRGGEVGFCGLGEVARWSAPARLWGEEPELGRPGLALAPTGCGLRCVFCYRDERLAPRHGRPLTAAEVAAFIEAAEGIEHLHFLGGNPDENLPAILDALALVARPRPVVWNTHAYLTLEQVELLEGMVDAVVADLKFGPAECAGRLAGVAAYWPVATTVLRQLASFELRLIVRHVALPGHLDCCAEPVVAWLRKELPGARLNLLTQYRPWGPARRDPLLGRRLSAAETARLAALGDAGR